MTVIKKSSTESVTRAGPAKRPESDRLKVRVTGQVHYMMGQTPNRRIPMSNNEVEWHQMQIPEDYSSCKSSSTNGKVGIRNKWGKIHNLKDRNVIEAIEGN